MKEFYPVRTIILAGSLLLQLGTLGAPARGAAGDVDLSFDPGSGVNGTVNAVAVQPDGKIVIGGEFTMVKGLARSKIARLNADGSGDSSFDVGPATDAWTDVWGQQVNAIALQCDGRTLVGHAGGISRLNSDGSPDTSFNASIAVLLDADTGNLTPSPVRSVVVQADGKVLIGSNFSTVNGANRSGIARLNADGSLDESFDPGAETRADVFSVALEPHGRVLIGGLAIVGETNYSIARLNANGSPDSSFHPAPGLSGMAREVFGYIYSIALQPDGKILIGGSFYTPTNGTNRRMIARLNADGSIDTSFGLVTGDIGVSAVALHRPQLRLAVEAQLHARRQLDGGSLPPAPGGFSEDPVEDGRQGEPLDRPIGGARAREPAQVIEDPVRSPMFPAQLDGEPVREVLERLEPPRPLPEVPRSPLLGHLLDEHHRARRPLRRPAAGSDQEPHHIGQPAPRGQRDPLEGPRLAAEESPQAARRRLGLKDR